MQLDHTVLHYAMHNWLNDIVLFLYFFLVLLCCLGTRALLCDFHREKAWGEWVRKQDHQVSQKEDALAKMRAIARADTLEMYEEAVQALKDSQNWRENRAFQNWFRDTWLSESKVSALPYLPNMDLGRGSHDLLWLGLQACRVPTVSQT